MCVCVCVGFWCSFGIIYSLISFSHVPRVQTCGLKRNTGIETIDAHLGHYLTAGKAKTLAGRPLVPGHHFQGAF